MGETRELAEDIISTRFADVPDDTLEHAKRAIRDYVGVALYGSHHAVGERLSRFVADQSAGRESTVIGRGRASATGAALANGTFGHAIDYDDTFESIVLHPTSPVFAAALAAAERVDASGPDLLTGYIVGCEAAYRIGHSTYPEHYRNGWHATGTIGSFGAAAAAGSIMDLDTDPMRRALGISASGSSSLKKNFGSMTKPLHAGRAAETGLQAAILAADGFSADADILEGPIGYGAVMTVDGGYDPAVLVEPTDRWAVLDIGFKPYPSGVITHAAMDALRSIVIDRDLAVADVESVTVTLDDAASEMLIHSNPEDALQAKFSIEFCLAAILRERTAGIHEFTDEYVGQPETRAAMATVKRAFESNLFGADYAGYGARVVVETTDGETVTAEEKHAPGSPTNPVSDDRLVAKFRECVGAVVDGETTDRLLAATDELDQPDGPERLAAALQPPAKPS